MDDQELTALYKRKAETSQAKVDAVQDLLDRRREWDDPSKRVLSVNDVQAALDGAG